VTGYVASGSDYMGIIVVYRRLEAVIWREDAAMGRKSDFWPHVGRNR
jgi:hypothetical protein